MKSFLHSRGVQKKQKVGFKISTLVFPNTGVTTKNVSPLDKPEHPPLATPIFILGDVKGKYLQIYRVVISQPLCKN